jgi:hypothetical protein
MLLHPDGSEEVLFPAGVGAVLDPAVSFDAQLVFFSYIPDATPNGINSQRNLAYGGADIYKINLQTRQVVRLTQQVWTPPSGAANWSTKLLSASPVGSVYLGYGVFNLGACPLPNGKLMFVSSRDGYMSNKTYTTPNLRLYIMDDDGRNVEPVGHINIGSALHPTVLMDGRVMFASFEGQGVRDQRNWGLWAIWPDGRQWEPLMSAFTEGGAFHFQAQLSDGRIAVTEYYNLNDNGFGTILAFNSQKQAGVPPFGSPRAGDSSNPAVQVGLWGPGVATAFQPRYTSFPFSPPGLVNLTAFSHGEDMASSVAQDGGYAGKVTHPASAPANDLLLVWTPGPANNLNRPTSTPYYDAGIYILKSGQVVNDYRNLVKIKNDPAYNELQPKAVVPYSAIYGIAQPAALPFLPNDGGASPLLPPGTPFGLIGTSSFYNRNTTPGFGSNAYNGLDSWNTSLNGESSNWFEQGADAGLYSNNDIHAVRIVALEGVSHRSYPSGDDTGFQNFAERERLRILGEIPLRKTDASGQPVLDPQGNPDTSFLAKIPADTPFTFQTLDKDGMVLNMAQTWHMVRPGEVRTDCGGCHAHNKLPVNFSSTAAALASYPVVDLTSATPLLTKDASGSPGVKSAGRTVADVEYYKDVKPILQRSCVSCHSKTGTAAAGLVLDDTTLVNGYDNTYNRLANDPNGQWGIPPVIPSHWWRQTNASRYVRAFQSRRSLLMWKLYGRRLDGWTNVDHPTESTPGVASTLPAGASPDLADVDYTGTMMPPPGSGIPALSEDEKMTIARWIDLGAPITAQGNGSYKGYFADEIKPTLALSSPRAGVNPSQLTTIRLGMFDAYSGINAASLSVIANFAVNGQPAGAELRSLFTQTDPSVWALALSPPIASLSNAHLVVHVKDNAGNDSTIDRWFSVGTGGPPPPPPITISPPSVTLAPSGTQQFTAGGGTVAWTISPATAGTISPSGLYTAPATVPAQQTVTVKAASTTDAANFATALVTLQPPPPPATFSISGSLSPAASVNGATVKLTGTATATVNVASSGAYVFPGLSNGSYTVTPSKSGYTFTPASQTVTVQGANLASVNFTGQALPPPPPPPPPVAGAISIDVSVARDQSPARSTVASPAFSTHKANELLLAFIATDSVASSDRNVTVRSVNGAGLTWVRVARTNVERGTSEIWRAFAVSPLSNVTVAATLSQTVVSSITVMSFAGVDTSGANGSGAVGAIGHGNAHPGLPSASLVTTRNNSWVFGVGNDFDNALARTPGEGQSLVHQYLAPVGDTYWAQKQNAPTPLQGTTVKINDTAPAKDRFNLTIVEVLPAQ